MRESTQSQPQQFNLHPMVWPGAAGQPHPTGDRLSGLTDRQLMVLAVLLAMSGRLITMHELAAMAGLVSGEAARSVTKRLRAKGLLAVTQVRGSRQGFTAEILLTEDEWESRTGQHVRTLARTAMGDRTDVRTRDRTPERTNQPVQTPLQPSTGGASRPEQPPGHVRTPVRTEERTSGQPADHMNSSDDNKLDYQTSLERPDAPGPSRKKEEEILSFSEGLRTMSEANFAALWPNLARIGFGVAKAREVLQRRRESGVGSPRLQEGLDHADAAVDMGLEKMAKDPVRSELAYVYGALMSHGYFDRPPGYLSVEERAERDAKLTAEAAEKAKQSREKTQFRVWKLTLEPMEVEAIRAKSAVGRAAPLDAVLTQEWQKRGRPLVDAVKVRNELEAAHYELWASLLEATEVELVWSARGWDLPCASAAASA